MLKIDPKYPSIEDLENRARKKMPRFAFDYLSGGANEEINLRKNTEDIRKVELSPEYLTKHNKSSMEVTLFNHTYSSPFGIAPIGLQGLMWPNSPEILALAAHSHNIPFILSTVTTSSIERISELTEGKAWFQLYHPTENKLRDDIIQRAEKSGCPVLVILCDTPIFGIRYKDIKNGLSMPPKMTLNNIFQMLTHPEWSLKSLYYGKPNFKNLLPYMPKGLNMKKLGEFMNQTFSGRLNEEKIKPIRDIWKGKLVLKGVTSEKDVEKAIKLGLDGIILSNHGGRQIDPGPSTISTLPSIKQRYGKKIKVMMDSGLRSGPDIGRCLALGADFTFLGRSFMYGVGALGSKGGEHTIAILKTQLAQLMEQLSCRTIKDFPKYLIKK